MTLKDWKLGLRPGRQMRCVYRWYWDRPTDPASRQTVSQYRKDGQLCTILHVYSTRMMYSTADQPKPTYMTYPRASELKATEKGFELYFPVDPKLSNPATGPDRSGKLMSRYEWVLPAPGRHCPHCTDVDSLGDASSCSCSKCGICSLGKEVA